MITKRRTSITMPPDVDAEVEARGPIYSNVIARDLDRLYSMYRRALARTPLTTQEACLLCDALNGSLMDAPSAHLLYAEIDDACRLDHLDAKWHVDRQGFVARLREMDDIQCMALVDAAERFWVHQGEEQYAGKSIEQIVPDFFYVRDDG